MNDDKKSRTPKDTHYAKLRRSFRDQKAGGPHGQAIVAAMEALRRTDVAGTFPEQNRACAREANEGEKRAKLASGTVLCQSDRAAQMSVKSP